MPRNKIGIHFNKIVEKEQKSYPKVIKGKKIIKIKAELLSKP